MTIKAQKKGEALKDRVEEDSKSVEDLAEEFMSSEEEAELESGVDILEPETTPTTIHRQRIDGAMVSNKRILEEAELAEVHPSTEPLTAPVGAEDHETPTHIAPQVLEEAHKFLNQYGIKTEGLTPKEVMHKLEKVHAAKEEAAQVLSRGQALDGIERLLTFVPEGYVGGFFRENDMDVKRAESLGFKVFEDERANAASSTGKSDGLVRLGDQILMIIQEEKYVAHRLVKADRLAERRKSHDPKSSTIDQGDASALVPLIKL